MSCYKVKASAALFDRGKNLKNRSLPLVGIVQNSATLSEQQIKKWNADVKAWITEIKEWRDDVVRHIENCNNDYK